ncbi:MAG: L-threonine 3-dehydrogenase [Parachlamydiales bacterium]|nr:L-threonine 3-dehydrogenase [Parachlamydiales bacterium]
MKALVKRHAKPGLWLEEVPTPEIGDEDLLIKIHKTAICGTDVHIYLWDEWAQSIVPYPMITGHEFCGEVVAMGSRVKNFEIGDRVSGEGHIVCGKCRNCLRGIAHLCPNTIGTGVQRPGCFAEYLSFPAFNAFKIPHFVEDSLAAFFDPFGNAVHTALSFDMVGEDVLITGAGPIGIMGAAIADHCGARSVVITDINDYRLDLARKLGATRTVNVLNESLSDVAKELGIDYGFDVVLEMSGSSQAMNQAIDECAMGAKIALLGILPKNAPINWPKMIFKGVTLKCIYGREIFGTWQKMVRLLESGLDISGLITHELPYQEFEKGFQAMIDGHSGKVILNWE